MFGADLLRRSWLTSVFRLRPAIFFREINAMLLVSAPTVNHYQKTNCILEYIIVYLCLSYV